MTRLRILALAPDAHPDAISTALVVFRHAEALARINRVTLVTRRANEAALRRSQAPFEAIESIYNPWLEPLVAWVLRKVFRNNRHSRALTPFFYPLSVAFEWRAWRQMRSRVLAGEFDVVLRLSPINTVIPSAFSFFNRNSSTPLVLGPINGGLPWPKGFSQADKQKAPIDRLRNLYRFLPFARSSYRRAAAIIAGSSKTYQEFRHYRDKLFFMPENGVVASLCSDASRGSTNSETLQLVFVGALIPLKACDLALRAAAPLLESGLVQLAIVGDGPERDRLEKLSKSLRIAEKVSFCGWLSHAETMQRMQAADVLLFPSVRDFGGGVVFEALAVGAVPIVAAFGGPGDIVNPEVGYKIPLTTESEFVAQMEQALFELAHDRNRLERLRKQGMQYARERLTWDTKAQDTTRILNWVLQRGRKPILLPPTEGPVSICESAAP